MYKLKHSCTKEEACVCEIHEYNFHVMFMNPKYIFLRTSYNVYESCVCEKESLARRLSGPRSSTAIYIYIYI